MKRKFLTLILSIITAFCMLAGVAACEATGDGDSDSGIITPDDTTSGGDGSSEEDGDEDGDNTEGEGNDDEDNTEEDGGSSGGSGGSGENPGENPETPETTYYTVTLSCDSAMGSVSYSAEAEDNKYAEDSTLTITATANSGYEFVGWYTDTTKDPVSESASYEITVTADVTYTAVFKAITYTVTYDYNDDTTESTAETVNYGNAATKPADPTYTGYTFNGWYYNGAEYDFNTTVTSDITLTAQWTINTYTVTFESNGGTEVTAQTVNYNATATAPTEPTRTGYTFAGWYLDGAETAYDFDSVLTSDITLTAQWTINTYTVKYVYNDGTDKYSTETVNYGSTATAPTVTYTGYTFDAWYTDENCTEANKFDFNTTVTDNITLYAKWTANPYTVTYSTADGCSVASETASVTYDSSYTLAVPTRTGYTFNGWYYGDTQLTDSNGASTAAYTYTTDITVTASWTAVNYTISFEENGGSEVSDITQGYETTVNAPENPTRTGYTFAGWYSDSQLETAYTFGTMPLNGITLYAKWTANPYTVTYNANGGSVSGTTASVTYGSSYTLEVPTRTGYTFNGWYYNETQLTGSNGASTANYTYTESITVTASWTANPYTVTYSTADGCSVASETASVTYGSSYTLEVPTRTGYTFNGWYYGDTQLTGSDGASTANYTNTESITVTANWTIINYNVIFTDGTTSTTVTYTINDSSVTAPAVTEKAGYTGAWEAYSLTYGADVTVNATYTANPYTVTYDANGGSVSGTTASVTYDSSYTLAVPTRTGYTFNGWYYGETQLTGSNGASTANYTYTESITVTASWTANPYTITTEIARDDSGSTTVVGTITATADCTYGTEVTLEATAATGYSFEGWYLNGTKVSTDGSTTYTFTVSGAATYTAKFALIPYTITYVSSISTTNENATSYTIESSEITLSDLSATDYTFNGWYSENTYTNKVTKISAGSYGDITLYASWTSTASTTHTVTLELSNNNAGAVSGGGSYSDGTSITITATVKDGYTFTGWYNGGTLVSSDLSCEVTVSADVTYTAIYTINNYTVTFKNGDETVNTQTYTVENTSITVPTVPTKDGYTSAWESYTLTYGDVTVNVVYTTITYYVTFVADNTEVSKVSYTIENTSIEVPAVPAKTGYDGAWDSYTLTYGDVTVNAVYTAIEYTITYVSNEVTIDTTNYVLKYTIETETFTLATLTDAGYTFGGWYDGTSIVTEITKGTTGNITLTAQWAINTYTVTFDYNDGTTANTSATVNYGSTASKPEDPTRTGYKFSGWYYDGSEYDFTTAVTADITLTAQWTINTYTVTFESNEGSSVEAQTVNYGGTAIAPTAPTRTGYKFAGWYSDNSLETAYNFEAAVTENVTLYAGWTAVTYYVYLYNGSTLVNTLEYTVESSDVTLTDLTVTGYEFGGWYTTSAFEGDAVTSVTVSTCANVTLYAKLTAISYGITYNNTKDAENSNPASYTVESGTDGVITLVDLDSVNGYEFKGWYTSSDFSDESKVTTITTSECEAVILYAKWEATKYDITYSSDVTITENTNPASYTIETSTITLESPTAAEGYTFAGWYDESGNVVTQIEIGTYGNISLTAKWTVTITTEIACEGSSNANNAGTVSGAGTYTYGTEVTLEVTEVNNGYTFLGWYDANGNSVSTETTYNITSVTASATYTAKFQLNTYTVTFSNDSSTSTDTYTVESTTITLPAAGTNGDYTFGGWYTEANGSGTLFSDSSTAISVTIEDKTESFTVYAYWYVTVTYAYATTDSGTIYETTTQLAKGVELTAPELTTYTDSESVTYSFVSWCTDSTFASTYSFGSALTADTTIYARFAQQVVLKNGIYYQYYGTNASSSFVYNDNGSYGGLDDNYSDVIPTNYYAISGYDSDTLSGYYSADSNYWLIIESYVDGFEVFATWSTVFSGLTTIVNVVLPSTLKYIDTKAFNSCTNLKNVIILADIVYLANGGTGSNYPFYSCSSTLNIYYNRVYSLGETDDGVVDNTLGFSYIKSSGSYIRVNISTSWTWVSGIEALVSVNGALESFDESAIRDAVYDALEAYFAANGITYNQFTTSWTDGYLFISTVLSSDTAESTIKTYVESGIDEAYASTALGLYGATVTIENGKITVAIAANDTAYYKTEVANTISDGGTFDLSSYTNNDGSATVTYTDGTTTVTATITSAKVYSYTTTDSGTVTALYVLSGASVTVTANVNGITLSNVTYNTTSATGDQSEGFTFTSEKANYALSLGWETVTASEYTVSVYSDISYSLDGADIASGTQTIDLGNDTATLDGKTVATTESYYYFLGWAYSNEGTLTFTSNITYSSDTTYYAIWGYGTTEMSVSTVTENSTLPTATISNSVSDYSYYYFAGWTATYEYTYQFVGSISENITVYTANWLYINATLSDDISPVTSGSSLSLDPSGTISDFSYAYFIGWSATVSGTYSFVGSVSENVNIYYANWLRIKYEITAFSTDRVVTSGTTLPEIKTISSRNFTEYRVPSDYSTTGEEYKTTDIVSGCLQYNVATSDSCVVEGTIVTMADGTTKAVEDIEFGDALLVWNFETGTYDTQYVYFVEEGLSYYGSIVTLNFSDGTSTTLVESQGYFDYDLLQYVVISAETVENYVGHSFAANYIDDDGNYALHYVTLVSYVAEYKTVNSYEIITTTTYSFFADSLMCTEPIFACLNIFEITSEMIYDADKMAEDIATYGLYTYEEWSEYLTYDEFIAFNGAIYKVAVGKGLITEEDLIEHLLSRIVTNYEV